MGWGNNSLGDAGYLAPIMQQINRTGDIMQYGDQSRRQEDLLNMQKQKNAFEMQVQGLQMEAAKQAQVEKVRHQNAFSQAYQTADPMKDPEGFARLYIQNNGNPEVAMKLMEDAQKGAYNLKPGEQRFSARGTEIAKNTTPDLSGDVKNFFEINKRMPTQQEWIELKRAGATNITPYQQESLRVREQGQQDSLQTRKDYQQEQMEFRKEQKDEAKQVKMAKDANLKRAIEYDLSGVDKVVDDLINSDGLQNLTGYTGRIPFTVRQSSVDAKAMLERLKSILMIDVLQSMKAASINGSSGFGALNQTEAEAIKTKLAALQEAQSYDQIVKELKGIKAWSAHTRNNLNQTFQETWEGRQPGAAGGSAYKSPDDVKAAFSSKKITQEQAVSILENQFGIK